MRVLLVTPSELSSGEAITALSVAERVVHRGGDCRVLASAFTYSLLAPRLGTRATRLTSDRDTNEVLWHAALRELRPDAVVFADYPLLFFSSGVAPLADDRWVARLQELDLVAITLDHLGYAQRVMQVPFGPPHLSMHTEITCELPARMRILLPCPMNEPRHVPGRRGAPFRTWDVPTATHDTGAGVGEGVTSPDRVESRESGQLLVVHTTPNWAWRIAKKWELPHYALLPAILEDWLSDLGRPVTIISVNNGELLTEIDTKHLRIRNSGVMTPSEYERLLSAADLLITDNAVSVTIGRAACAFVPVALLNNSRRLTEVIEAGEPEAVRVALEMERRRFGSVFRYEAFPIWNAEDIEQLGLFRDNSVTGVFSRVEFFGGSVSRQQLRALLTDPETGVAREMRQRRYVEEIGKLPDAYDAIAALLAGSGGDESTLGSGAACVY